VVRDGNRLDLLDDVGSELRQQRRQAGLSIKGAVGWRRGQGSQSTPRDYDCGLRPSGAG
jgi:hypothetical protein